MRNRRAGSLDAVRNSGATAPCKVPHKALNSAHTDQTCIPDKARGSSSPPIWANQCIVCSAEDKFEDILWGVTVQIKLRTAGGTDRAITTVVVASAKDAQPWALRAQKRRYQSALLQCLHPAGFSQYRSPEDDRLSCTLYHVATHVSIIYVSIRDTLYTLDHHFCRGSFTIKCLAPSLLRIDHVSSLSSSLIIRK